MGDGAAAVIPGRGHHFFRGQVEVVGLFRPGLGDFPILAELAVQVAARGGDGKREAPGQDVEEGFFFNGVQVDGAGVAVHQAVIFALPVLPDAAFPPVSGQNLAVPGTELALHQALVHLAVEGGRMGRHEAVLHRLGAGRPGGEGQQRQGPGAGLDKSPAAAPTGA